ncbi:SCO3242 family prenyltransferase [Streptomyces marianii]|uniref:4-hydroxybenzoate polyprenyltransferase n=1 Tax=Streptomyces marianii TaxID=1817406 RepID=A0A5R9DXN6_9ACTN|nr:UbiA family prenyltransferase [Streptomyces marianii]TLQ41947.1 4-hydroxybenzoate polyprenyltransferase [Streptomyces marianii]
MPAVRPSRWRTLVELVRAPAALTVPGDVLAGAAAAGEAFRPRLLGLAASSVTLYWAGMALNDWADRHQDAVERPGRPLPSGRVTPGQAFALASVLTSASLGLAAAAGGRRVLLRRALPLAASVWAYDLGLKATPVGPTAMAAARGLDVLLGVPPGRTAAALPAAAAVAGHTFAVTWLSRHEVHGGTTADARTALAVTAAVALGSTAGRARTPTAAATALTGTVLYAATALRAQIAALEDPAPARVRNAVGAGIHALLPLQAALTARAGAPALSVPLAAALPLACRLARKVSPT